MFINAKIKWVFLSDSREREGEDQSWVYLKAENVWVKSAVDIWEEEGEY